MPVADLLLPELRKAFPDRAFRTGNSPEPIAVFPAACPEVGHVSIYDDGDEATVLIENVTHHHVNPYDAALTPEEAARRITEDVVDFLRELFADRVLLWSIDQGRKGGGWERSFDGAVPNSLSADADVFVWARCIQKGRPSTR